MRVNFKERAKRKRIKGKISVVLEAKGSSMFAAGMPEKREGHSAPHPGGRPV